MTARYVDPGALVPAATGSTQSALPLVDIADLRRLRITIFVQQDAAPFLHVGDPVTITVDQRPDLMIDAPVTRFAHALDTRSRIMLCEVWLDNTHHLYPGTVRARDVDAAGAEHAGGRRRRRSCCTTTSRRSRSCAIRACTS